MAFDEDNRLGVLDRAFRGLLHGPHPRCLRFAVTVTGDRARLASDVRGLLSSSVGLSPWVTSRSFRCYLLFSSSRLPWRSVLRPAASIRPGRTCRACAIS